MKKNSILLPVTIAACLLFSVSCSQKRYPAAPASYDYPTSPSITASSTVTCLYTFTMTQTTTSTFTYTETSTSTPASSATFVPSPTYTPTLVLSLQCLIDDFEDGDLTNNLGGEWIGGYVSPSNIPFGNGTNNLKYSRTLYGTWPNSKLDRYNNCTFTAIDASNAKELRFLYSLSINSADNDRFASSCIILRSSSTGLESYHNIPTGSGSFSLSLDSVNPAILSTLDEIIFGFTAGIVSIPYSFYLTIDDIALYE